MAELPPEYYEGVQTMLEAGVAWQKAHPFAEPRFALKPFEDEMKRRAGLPPEANAIIGANLDEVIDQIAVNEDAKAMLRALDAATGNRASYFQFKCLYEMQIEEHVRRNSGQHAAGDWRCPCCGEVLDGYAAMIGKSEGKAPPPGSLSLCAYCGGLAQVNDAQNGFVSLRDADIPPELRKQIHEMRNQLHAAQAKRARQS